MPNWVATGVELEGERWNLARGVSGGLGGGLVFTFVKEGGKGGFEGDLMGFLAYLVKGWGVPASQNLVYVAAGMEPFT